MIEARRKDNETTGAFLRRFTRKVQRSGVLIRSRRIKFKPSVAEARLGVY